MNSATDKHIGELTDELDVLATKYDARILAATLGVRAARIYARLADMGYQDPEQIPKIFAELQSVAQEKPTNTVEIVDAHPAPRTIQ